MHVVKVVDRHAAPVVARSEGDPVSVKPRARCLPQISADAVLDGVAGATAGPNESKRGRIWGDAERGGGARHQKEAGEDVGPIPRGRSRRSDDRSESSALSTFPPMGDGVSVATKRAWPKTRQRIPNSAKLRTL